MEKDNLNKTVEATEAKIQKDSFAKWSFGLGLVSVLLVSIGIIPLLAIIFGAIGINRTKEEGTGRWMAVVGLVLGIVFFISNAYMNGYFMSAYDRCVEQYNTFNSYGKCNHLK